jgi:4'-phosphopantetheinyl transferase EntD
MSRSVSAAELDAALRGLFGDVPDLAIATRTEPGDPRTLHAEERAAVANAVATRRREFAAGRQCLHAALADLGLDCGPIGVGAHREPLLPDGVAASLSHCRGLCAAVAAARGALFSLGLDVELDQPLESDIARLVCDDEELASSEAYAGAAGSKLLFAAKEAIYKAWFPLQHRYLDFKEVRVHPRPGSTRFNIEWLVEAPSGVRFEGRCVAHSPWLLAGVAVFCE